MSAFHKQITPPSQDGTEYTDWINVSVFGKQAETCQKHLGKGSQVCVEGRLQYRQWTQDGKNREAVEVRAYRVEFLKIKKGEEYDDPSKSTVGERFNPDEQEDPFG